jgi:SAM-dependent methyltransferase
MIEQSLETAPVQMVVERISTQTAAPIFARRDLPLAEAFTQLRVEHSDHWGWDNYTRVIRHLAASYGAGRLIEIGGGRSPHFMPAELAAMGVELTVNDISAKELLRLPSAYRTACFDVAGDLTKSDVLPGSYDLAFSKMVFEHVEDGERAWRNVHQLLAPRGVAIAFLPTLFALPFVLNKILPDGVAEQLIKLVNRERNDETSPVFPARYSKSYTIERWLRPMFSRIGYRDLLVVPFYGHAYYRRFPIVRDVHAQFTKLARANDWRLFSSYAYIVARK